MFTRTILCAAFLGTIPASFEDPFPKYGVAPGTKLSRTWTTKTEMKSGPATLYFDGEEVPTEGHGTMKLSVVDERSLRVVDEIETIAAGRPKRFQRTYDALSNRGVETIISQPATGDATEKENGRDRTSPLEKRVVGFVWNPQDEAYERDFVGEDAKKDGDKVLLDGLAADADWLELLADGPRAKGESFELPEELFERVQYPLGELNWQIDGKDADDTTKEINVELAANLSGAGKAVWAGVREDDGKQIGVFQITADLTSKADAEAEERGEKRAVELKVGYEGEVLWDMAAGRLAGYEIEASVTSILTSERMIETPKGKGEVRQVFELEGITKHKLVVAQE